MVFLNDTIAAPDSVVGYHGCHIETARLLLDGGPFRASTNDYDWLGSGVYFWEYAPNRAREWAEALHGKQWAVLTGTIRLGDCLNLLDNRFYDDLKRVHREMVATFETTGLELPKNRGGANRLDRLVIDELCDRYRFVGAHFDTVRGCFPEGSPLFEGSTLLSLTHAQIAVRNPACIGNLELVNYS